MNILYSVREHPQGWAGRRRGADTRREGANRRLFDQDGMRRFCAGGGPDELYQFLGFATQGDSWIQWSHRAKESRRLLLSGVFINLVLALRRSQAVILGRSNALIADGIESSLDVLSSAMMWGAIKYAERPPDSDHPYGHGKMESLAAVAGSLLLIVAGAALGVHSIHEIILPAADSRIPRQRSGWFHAGRSWGDHRSQGGSLPMGPSAQRGHRKQGPCRRMPGTIAPTR